MFSILKTMIWRDLMLYGRSKNEWITPLLFFGMVALLFPMALGPEPARLAWASAAIIWVAAILATLLSLDRIFRSDYDDGIIDQLILSPYPLSLLVLGKTIAHWIAIGLPLLIIASVLGVFLNLTTSGIQALCLTLLIGTPVLSLVGCIGVALTVALKRGGVLLAVIVLPLYVPVLVFGTSGVVQAMHGVSFVGHLAILGALLLLSIVLAPLAIAGALKVSVS